MPGLSIITGGNQRKNRMGRHKKAQLKPWSIHPLTRIFHTLPGLAASMSLTPCFSWVWKRHQRENRFNGLPHPVETVETVLRRTKPLFTQLKQGVNERGLNRRGSSCGKFGVTSFSVMFILF